MATPERIRRNRLEQLQADAKALEHLLARLKAKIASATRAAKTAEAERLSTADSLKRVRAAVQAEKQRSALPKPSLRARLVGASQTGVLWAGWLLGSGMAALTLSSGLLPLSGVRHCEFLGPAGALLFLGSGPAIGLAVVFGVVSSVVRSIVDGSPWIRDDTADS